MKDICSEEYDSILRDGHEGEKNFRWSSSFHELAFKMPMLMKLLLSLVSGVDDSRKVILVVLLLAPY